MSLKTIVISFADFILLEERIIIIRFTFDGELTVKPALDKKFDFCRYNF